MISYFKYKIKSIVRRALRYTYSSYPKVLNQIYALTE